MTATAPRFGTFPARNLLAAVVLIGTLLGALLTAAGPASAHAAMTGSNPKDGAVVPTAPQEVTLAFSEQVAMADDSIRVLEPSGKRADKAKLRDLSTDGKVSFGVDLLPGLPNGTYTVAWRAVSADSHPVSGAFTFSIGAPSKTQVALPEAEAGGGLVGVLYDIARYTAYAGFILLVGGGAFILVCWQRGASVRALQRLVVQGWVALTGATLAMLLLRTPYTGSGKLADAFDLSGLRDVLETKTGAALVSRLLLLGAAALFIAVLFGAYAKGNEAQEQRAGGEEGAGGDAGDEGADGEGEGEGEGDASGAPSKNDLTFGLAIGGTVVGAGIAATWALSEHASTGIQPGVAMPVDVLHLLAMAAWLGGLAALLTALYRAPALERAAVRRFSQVAFASVATLAATGIYQSWRQVGSWSALTGTGYGQLLLIKVALVVVMVGTAWISRRWTAQLADTVVADTVVAESGTEADAANAADAEEGTETEREREQEREREPVTVLAGGDPAAETGRGEAESADPARAAQLARQQAAVATARRKKARDADPVQSGLRRSVLAEAGIAVVLLAVTTVLTSTEPGRTEEEAARAGGADIGQSAPGKPVGPASVKLLFDTGGQNGKGIVRLTFAPNAPGANDLHVYLDGPNGKPLDAPEVKVSFTLKEKQIGPLPITPDRVTAGHWSANPVQIPMPGDWTVQIVVRTSDIDQTTVEKIIKIG